MVWLSWLGVIACPCVQCQSESQSLCNQIPHDICSAWLLLHTHWRRGAALIFKSYKISRVKACTCTPADRAAAPNATSRGYVFLSVLAQLNYVVAVKLLQSSAKTKYYKLNGLDKNSFLLAERLRQWPKENNRRAERATKETASIQQGPWPLSIVRSGSARDEPALQLQRSASTQGQADTVPPCSTSKTSPGLSWAGMKTTGLIPAAACRPC